MMDRALKERIIGAVVLVCVVVLVVPVFLDGRPSNNETVSKVVPLPGQEQQETQTIVLDRDRQNPVPAVSGNGRKTAATQAPEAGQAAATQPPASAQQPPDPPTEPRQATASATGMWAVQLGSFGDQQNAERLAAELRAQGFAAFLSKLAAASGDLHRVRIGPQKDREAAEAVAARLAEAGHKGQVVPHP
jgi:DedD protein